MREWMAADKLVALNGSETPTCEHPGYPSAIDLTLINNTATVSTTGWRVLDEEESGSDQRYISFHVV